jgi:hypothetical protein
MANVRLFLSTVSAEFLSYRDRLRHLLTRPNVEVRVQEDFIVTGDETLEMLDTYIQGCDAVIHLVGDMTGAMARPQSVAAIAARYPGLASRLPLGEFLQPEGPCLSYTQWEAWLALWHGKKLFIATPQQQAPRDERYSCDPGQQALDAETIRHLHTSLRALPRPQLESLTRAFRKRFQVPVEAVTIADRINQKCHHDWIEAFLVSYREVRCGEQFR